MKEFLNKMIKGLNIPDRIVVDPITNRKVNTNPFDNEVTQIVNKSFLEQFLKLPYNERTIFCNKGVIDCNSVDDFLWEYGVEYSIASNTLDVIYQVSENVEKILSKIKINNINKVFDNILYNKNFDNTHGELHGFIQFKDKLICFMVATSQPDRYLTGINGNTSVVPKHYGNIRVTEFKFSDKLGYYIDLAYHIVNNSNILIDNGASYINGFYHSPAKTAPYIYEPLEGDDPYDFNYDYNLYNLSYSILNPELEKEILESYDLIKKFFIFLEYAPVENKELFIVNENNSNKKFKLPKSKAITKTKINYIDCNYFTNLFVKGDFKVSGHFRLQPVGAKREKKKLIWIKDFNKTGYTRKAKILKDRESD